MRSWQVICLLLALGACLVSAKKGSISKDLFEDDINDDPKAPMDEREETESSLREGGRKAFNPCYRKKCYRGEVCTLNDKEEAMCVCRDDCTRFRTEGDRHKVCSNKNDTYLSECDLDRDHCLCKHDEEGCTKPDARKIQLEYYGSCKELKECQDHEMAQFPKRMREWLFIVMEVMERRHALKGYQELLEEAKKDTNHSMAVIWKFCDLDKDPQDRYVSRRELQMTVRTLKGLEHCLTPFLDECDADDNREITLTEWGHCLDVDQEVIKNRCVDLRGQGKKDKRRK